jgi:hypothetical protein
VDRHGAGDGPHRSGSHAEIRDGLDGFLNQLRMSRQPEIVVRGEIDDGSSVEMGRRLLPVLEHPERAIETLLSQRVELCTEITKRVVTHQDRVLLQLQ